MVPAIAPRDISPDTMIPDLLRASPQARAVLDRYGLRGCGGENGPVESLRFFARTHGVAESTLLHDLRDAGNASPVSESPLRPLSQDAIYRRYFYAGIILILSFGATWGAWLLWRIGVSGTFTGASIHEINAHGHAQIFGWVGLFVMGFGYQAFARMWQTELVAPRLAGVVFAAMLSGLVLRTCGMALTGHVPFTVIFAMVGAALEFVAVLIFATQILVTFRRSGQGFDPYVAFIAMALLWFVLMAAADAAHGYVTMTAPSRSALLWYVSTYQAPLRDLQIHGVALFIILGVSIKMVPAMYDRPSASRRQLWSALAVLTFSVIAECLLFVAYRWTGRHELAALLMLPWLGLAAGAAIIALPWKLWQTFAQSDRTAKFIRAAYTWLAVSLAMLLFLPAYLKLGGMTFSHAYYGAIRHAITVGFISMMIMGFAAKVVPTLNGLDIHALSRLRGPFLLINIGCFLRVSTQTLTDFYPGAFSAVGVSGTLEVIALAWWGLGLVRIMYRGKRVPEVHPATPAPTRIGADHLAADVIAWYPATIVVFDRFGFSALRQPVLRRTLGRATTLKRAASMKGIDVNDLLRGLNACVGHDASDAGTKRVTLSVLPN